jgi:hypothetical protein
VKPPDGKRVLLYNSFHYCKIETIYGYFVFVNVNDTEFKQ